MAAHRRPRPPLGAVLVSVVDGLFFLLGAIAAAVLAVLTVRRVLFGGAEEWWLLLVLWALLAYLLLPRVHTMLAVVYVPDYFIGRTRTYEGLLGDPVNLALLGTEEQVHAAMTRAGWRLADELGFRSGLRIVTSTLTRRTYPTAPVSPLFLFGRMQEFTYQQEVEGSPARRHHVRFWRTPEGWFLPGGAVVDWVAAGTYDRRVGFSAFTLQITHKIAPDTDVERDHVVQTLVDADPVIERRVIRHFSSGYHSRNGGGDAIVTDGDLPVLDLTGVDPEGAHGVGATSHRTHGSLRTQAKVLVATVRDTAASNRIKRPMTLYLGYGLMLLRACVAVATVVLVLAGALPTGAEARWLGLLVLPEDAAVLVPVVAVAVVAYVAVGQRTFGGHPLARLVALTLSVVGIALALVDGPAAASGLPFRIWLLDLVLDIGILLTLSAGDVRDFALRTTATRAGLRSSRNREAVRAEPS